MKNQKVTIKHVQGFIADIETNLFDFILEKNVTPKSVFLPNQDKIDCIVYDSSFETYTIHFKKSPIVVLYKHNLRNGFFLYTDSLYL